MTAEQYISIVCTGTAVQCNSTSRSSKIEEYDSLVVSGITAIEYILILRSMVVQ